ncbi:MAG: type 4a pilus biogenesis protein PilO [Desulfosarcinaceae bacterium]|nr:type 4a pilus biogenesis protein PilO [Desulfosarcinaceae bacterium]
MKKAKVTADSLSPIFEKIEQLTKVQRILITVGVFVLLLGGFSYFSYWPKYQKIGELKKTLVAEEKKLEVAKRNARQLNSWRAKMKSKEEQFKVVRKALPEKEEIPSLLASISQSGKDAGLEFELFQPKPEVEKDFYAEIPVAINVTGSYHDVASFFDRVAVLSRIVNIEDIHVFPKSGSVADTGKLTTECTAVTYKFIDKPKKSKNASSKKGRKKK